MLTGKILFFSDVHIPYQHPQFFDFIRKVIKTLGPFDRVICLGDLCDQYYFSKFAKHPDAEGSQMELKMARKEIKKLAKIIPELDYMVGNHESRIFKRAAEIGISNSLLKSISEIYEFPEGWRTIKPIVQKDLMIVHGDEVAVSGTDIPKQFNRVLQKNVIHGHFHAEAGVRYFNNNDKTNFVLSLGCLVDRNAFAFDYGNKYGSRLGVIGCGILCDGAPHYVTMEEIL